MSLGLRSVRMGEGTRNVRSQAPSRADGAGDGRSGTRAAPDALRWAVRGGLGAVRAVRRPVESWIVGASEVGPGPFLDPARFGWIPALEAGHQVVRDELEALLAADIEVRSTHDMNAVAGRSDARWQTLLLRYYGMRCGVADRCPGTAELLDAVPGLRAASFSILRPGAAIPPHRGPYAGVVRYHLALIVPEPADACGIRVRDEVAHWEEGRSLLFDESYEHEAWNRTGGLRAVLFLDIVRPLRQPARAVNSALLAAFAASPYARSTKRRNLEWESSQGLAPPL